MGENLAEKGRMAVRTPMQWTSESSGGFSNAKPRKLVADFPDDGYGPEHVNVAAQRGDPDSLYSFIRSLIFRYRQHPEFGWGAGEIIDVGNDAVLVIVCSWEETKVITAHNLAPEGTTVSFTIDDMPEGSVLVDLLEETSEDLDATGKVELTLDGYGFCWMRVQPESDVRLY